MTDVSDSNKSVGGTRKWVAAIKEWSMILAISGLMVGIGIGMREWVLGDPRQECINKVKKEGASEQETWLQCKPPFGL